MHGGSSKKDMKLKIIPIEWVLEPCIPPGVLCLPCMYQLKVICNQLKVFKQEALGIPKLSKCMSTYPMNLDMSI